jgi:chorismate synthase
MFFGDKFKIEITENSQGVNLRMSGVPKGIAVTALDFGKDLARREMEGALVNPKEEIDVVAGIVEEMTTGEDILFEYRNGNKTSAMILAGVLAKKILNGGIEARATDIGGISTHEKNSEYINIGIQKMIVTKDSMGGTVECSLPGNIDMNLIKGELSNLLFSMVPEIEAVQFGIGVKASKDTALSRQNPPKKFSVTFGPDRSIKYPSIAAVMDVFIEAVAAVVVINKFN